jgi:TetR/AcrR family transcriptional regulator, regulator of cefoperazone and chloramphenicol sensitivity
MLFTEHGFHKVTVRDIAREAHANLAAVSYHFGDKLGLYREVLQSAVDAMRTVSDETMQAPPGSTAEERLRLFVRVFLSRIMTEHAGRATWIHKLMKHETFEPTPLAEWIVEQAVLPRLRYLEGIVAELLEADANDSRVRFSVLSLQAQCVFCMRHPLHAIVRAKWHDGRESDPDDVEAMANHISEFTLAGIRHLRSER